MDSDFAKRSPVTFAERPYPFPSRTRKSSSPAPKILRGQLLGKIGRRRALWHPGVFSPLTFLLIRRASVTYARASGILTAWTTRNSIRAHGFSTTRGAFSPTDPADSVAAERTPPGQSSPIKRVKVAVLLAPNVRFARPERRHSAHSQPRSHRSSRSATHHC